jgi:hypothetical protein
LLRAARPRCRRPPTTWWRVLVLMMWMGLLRRPAPAKRRADDWVGPAGRVRIRALERNQPGLVPAPVILISTHAEQDYADLIAASPAIGFLPKTALSGNATRDLLAGHGDGDRGNPRP